MQFDVIIPTRGDSSKLKNILTCIAQQALLPQRIIFVVNQYTGSQLQLQWDVTREFWPDMYKRIDWHFVGAGDKMSGNASYARNQWCKLAVSDHIYFIDDDNIFGPDFFTRTIAEYLSYKQEYKSEIVYSPTIQWRETDIIQSQWIKAYHFHVWRPEPVIFDGWKNRLVSKLRFMFPLPSYYKNTHSYCRVASIGGNSLFWLRSIFTAHSFDEAIPFVYEDIDCLCRIVKANIPLLVSKKNTISHMERSKTSLEKSFLATPESAYMKSRNRIIFVRKNATLMQKIGFFVIWLPVTSLMTMLFIIKWAGSKSFEVLQSYMSGILAWLKKKI